MERKGEFPQTDSSVPGELPQQPTFDGQVDSPMDPVLFSRAERLLIQREAKRVSVRRASQ